MPKGTKPMTTTWSMKKKPSGELHGRLNAQGHEQQEGMHYFADSIAAPVTNPMPIRIVLTMLGVNPGWIAFVIDVEGAFLQGRFTNGEELYIKVSEGFEHYYEEDVVLLLNIPIDGTKQAVEFFYKALV